MTLDGLVPAETFSSDKDGVLSQKMDGQSIPSPISKLPPELLHDIIQLMAECYPLGVWLPVTHVCQIWREVAVASSSLWTKPATRHYDLALLMLERSKTAELVIEFDASTSDGTMIMIMAHIHRIKSLSIIQPSHLLQSSCEELDARISSASRLEHVTIQAADAGARNIISVSLIDFRQLPRLRSIVFANIGFHWAALPLPKIISLHLVDTAPDSVNQPPNLFLGKLAQMPHLESIKVCGRSVKPISRTFLNTPVHLPRLTSAVFLGVNFRSLELILSHLVMPRLRHLRIIMAHMDSDCAPLITVVSSLLLKGDFDTCHCLIVTDRSVQFTAGTTIMIERSQLLYVTSVDRFRPGTLIAIALVVLSPRVLLHITELRFFAYKPPQKLLELCARYLPNVKLILMQHAFVGGLMGLGPPQGSEDVPFPKLTHIILYVSKGMQQSMSWKGLIHWLRVRRIRSRDALPMRGLTLINFGTLDDDTSTTLKELGLEVKILNS